MILHVSLFFLAAITSVVSQGPCPSNSGINGYTSIADINTAMATKVTAIQGGAAASPPYTFTICPNTELAVTEPLKPVLSGAEFVCGSDGSASNQCTFQGGANQVSIQDSAVSGYPLQIVTFRGITFKGSTQSSVLAGAGSETTANFVGCIWDGFSGDSAIQQNTTSPKGMTVAVTGGSVQNSAATSVFNNNQGTLDINGLSVSGSTGALKNIFYSSGDGATMTVNGTTINDNSPGGPWDGITYNQGASGTVQATQFARNSGVEFGVNAQNGSTVTVIGSSFEGNSPNGQYPAVANALNNSRLILQDTNFTDNTKFLALSYTGFASYTGFENATFRGGDPVLAVFIDRDSRFALDGIQFINVQSQACQEPQQREFIEDATSNCFYRTPGNCTGKCGIVKNNTLAPTVTTTNAPSVSATTTAPSTAPVAPTVAPVIPTLSPTAATVAPTQAPVATTQTPSVLSTTQTPSVAPAVTTQTPSVAPVAPDVTTQTPSVIATVAPATVTTQTPSVIATVAPAATVTTQTPSVAITIAPSPAATTTTTTQAPSSIAPAVTTETPSLVTPAPSSVAGPPTSAPSFPITSKPPVIVSLAPTAIVSITPPPKFTALPTISFFPTFFPLSKLPTPDKTLTPTTNRPTTITVQPTFGKKKRPKRGKKGAGNNNNGQAGGNNKGVKGKRKGVKGGKGVAGNNNNENGNGNAKDANKGGRPDGNNGEDSGNNNAANKKDAKGGRPELGDNSNNSNNNNNNNNNNNENGGNNNGGGGGGANSGKGGGGNNNNNVAPGAAKSNTKGAGKSSTISPSFTLTPYSLRPSPAAPVFSNNSRKSQKRSNNDNSNDDDNNDDGGGQQENDDAKEEDEQQRVVPKSITKNIFIHDNGWSKSNKAARRR